uniref:Acetyl-coenzyme A synthetase n=1 Tax=Plectus sambesii TaxID=2011161 RepID=A0A914WHU9_9BILA
MSDVKPKFGLNPIEDVFEPPAPLLAGAHVSGLSSYQDMYRDSLANSETFWKRIAADLYFENASDRGLEWNFDVRKGDIFIRFMQGARTNVAYNCLERNIARGLGSKIAFFWEGNELGDERKITYQELLDQVTTLSAVLRAKGVKKGDRVAIYLPMIIELPVAMLACARIGAVHSVVFAGFSSESLASRIIDGKARVLITADGFCRGPKVFKLKQLADDAIKLCREQNEPVETCIVVKHLERVRIPSGADRPQVNYDDAVDVDYTEEMSRFAGAKSPVEWMDAEDYLFMLYTSGSTGKPKGVVHTQAGYMTYSYATAKFTFDLQDDDVYWCTADCGWITGHTYIVYGPLMNATTGIIFEGIPTHPDPGRCWNLVEKYKVTKMYTAPTLIRSLMAFKEEFVTKYDRSSLKILGSVGEPINPAAWLWYYKVVGESRCAIVDTYWQTETGGHIITPMPAATPTKPGSATLPFFGVEPVIVDAQGQEIEGPGEGNLCIKRPWPGIMRTVYGDADRFAKTYFASFPGYYFTGDGARRDEDGYLWVTGRVDDLMNVSGHLLSTAEIESALVAHHSVAEAAVVAAPHDIKGSTPYAFVSLKVGAKLTPALIDELKLMVRTKIGAIAVPDAIQYSPGLPKTRSGKITRRILRKIAEGDRKADLGDTTTLADESVIAQLWEGRNGGCCG